jgi:hypothetical protein
VVPGVLEVGEEVLFVPGELLIGEEAVVLAVLVSPGELVLRGEVFCLTSREGESGPECATGFATANCIVICSSTLRI